MLGAQKSEKKSEDEHRLNSYVTAGVAVLLLIGGFISYAYDEPATAGTPSSSWHLAPPSDGAALPALAWAYRW
ncbi:MAG: hypothetical protein HY423_03820 [Candidatus Lambdaproteobacteria bacterium]|nr:hypothetical protein [Candidatus Lambdaproteobacteria bacterium]